MEQTYAIELKNITKRFGKIVANDGINLKVKRGEILSLLGENGSGKTTLMNMISGIYFPDEGHILVDGQRVDIPSYSVKPGQTISVREKSANLAVVKASLEATIHRPDFVTFDEATMTGTYVRLPERSEVFADIHENLIVEFYSR